MLDEHEFEIINIIGAKIAANQRDLSRHLNLSLGQTNMLLRRLITKGYIRISQLNKRKVQYLLTPKGFSEKMDKSIKYTLKTINSIGLIKERLRAILTDLYQRGERRFLILGESDLAFLVEAILRELMFSGCSFERIKDVPADALDGMICVCQEDVYEKIQAKNKIDLIHELSKKDIFKREINDKNF